MRYASIAQLKAWLKLESGGDDPLMDLVLDLVTAGLEDYSGIKFLKATQVKVMHPNGSFFYVSPFPIDATQPMILRDCDRLVATSDYIVSPDIGRVQLKYGEFAYTQYPSVSFAWTGGYAESGTGNDKRVQVPDKLVRACLLQAAYEYKNREHLGLSAIALGGGSVQLAPAKLLPSVTDILDKILGPIHV